MSQRVQKVQKLTRQVLGEEIQNLKDPRIGFATVTAVRVTPDLRQARVFVSVLGSDDEKEATMAALKKAAPHLRRELDRQMRMKYSPELMFELDQGAEVAERMEEIFKQLHHDEEDGSGDG
jgi:ribosome-binding factor A